MYLMSSKLMSLLLQMCLKYPKISIQEEQQYQDPNLMLYLHLAQLPYTVHLQSMFQPLYLIIAWLSQYGAEA